MSGKTTAIPPLFASKISKTDECWNWIASLDQKGYGYFGFGGRVQRAHRVAWQLEHGEIPASLEVEHRCRNRACVQPDHLRLATRKQNMENMSPRRSGTKSGIRGVSWHAKTGKWRGRVRHNLETISLGLFTDLGDAEAAVVAKRNEVYTHNDADRTVA